MNANERGETSAPARDPLHAAPALSGADAPAGGGAAQTAADRPVSPADARDGAPDDAPGGAAADPAPAEPPTALSAGPADVVSAPSPRVGFIRQYELVDRVKAYDPDADEGILDRAYVFSMRAHGHQKRQSGDPYFTHPLAVAAILTELRADPATVVTALLHDTVEDTETTLAEIEEVFGAHIARLVDGVTKLTRFELKSESTKQAENFRKLVLAMAEDVRVVLVKLADRLHNMRTLHFVQNPEKRRRVAHETLEIFAPLAGRLGVQRFREELEDLSFQHLNPDGYVTIRDGLEGLAATAVHSVVDIAQSLRVHLAEAGVEADVYSREKRPYSIWRKMQAKNVLFEELADIYAFRVLVENVDDCYRALGVIHRHWRMIHHEFDDYISTPKPNGYRSIHTAVLGEVDKAGRRPRVEVQIRTREMHDQAERGVAAHWRYKDPGARAEHGKVEIGRGAGQFDPYGWARNAVEMLQHGDDPEEFLENAKLELFQDQVFCFTPKGRVIALPRGATAVDFAYALHTDVGDSCVGVRVNGRSKPLRTPLATGDVVEILRSADAPPAADLESYAVTGRARSAIRRRIKRLAHAEQVKLGRAIAESGFAARDLEFSEKAVANALRGVGQPNVEAALAAIGRGELAVDDVIDAAIPGAPAGGAAFGPRGAKARPAVAIAGLTPGVALRLAKCCTPLPGERIVGVRREGGVVEAHTIYCDRLAALDSDAERWIDLRWRDDASSARGVARIVVTTPNMRGVLGEIARLIAQFEGDIANVRLANRSTDFVDMLIDVEVDDAKHLAQMLAALRSSARVISADRASADDDGEEEGAPQTERSVP